MSRVSERGPRRAVTLALGVQLVVMVAFLRVIDTELSLPLTSPPLGGTLAASRPVGATFGQAAELVAFDGRPVPGEDALSMQLTWRARDRFDHPAYAGVIVVGSQGEVLGVQDWLVGGGLYPATCWRPGQLVGDATQVALDSMPPGEYWLSLRLFDPTSGEPLPVSVSGLPVDTQVGLGPISVP